MTTGRRFAIALAVIAIVAAAPFVVALGTGLLAALIGCELDEGGVHPCVVSGVDLGYPLYVSAGVGLLMLILAPFDGAAFLVLLVVAAVVFLAPRLRKR